MNRGYSRRGVRWKSLMKEELVSAKSKEVEEEGAVLSNSQDEDAAQLRNHQFRGEKQGRRVYDDVKVSNGNDWREVGATISPEKDHQEEYAWVGWGRTEAKSEFHCRPVRLAPWSRIVSK